VAVRVARAEGEMVACTRCGVAQPYTTQYFRREGERLRMPCRECQIAVERRYRERVRAGTVVPRGRTRKAQEVVQPQSVRREDQEQADDELYTRETNRWFRVMVREILAEMYPH
jgi:uncharacterized protein YbaR (Trm112 family)